MAHQENRTKRVIAVVPAYDEEVRIRAVLRVLTAYRGFDEVIVVDDGSRDQTAAVAREYPVRVIRLEQNVGKGGAIEEALRAQRFDIVFLCDADVQGLTEAVIAETLAPVIQGETDMMIAMRNRKIYFARFVLAFIPLLGGERALTERLWRTVPALYKRGFQIEAALNHFARHAGRGFKFKVFSGLTQTIKERKYGLVRGFLARMAMFGEILLVQWRLQWGTREVAYQSAEVTSSHK